MNLSTKQLNAFVNTLELEHNKIWASKVDEEGLTKKELQDLKLKNERIRKGLNSLSMETKLLLQEEDCSWFKGLYRGKENKGKLEDVKVTFEILKDQLIEQKEEEEHKSKIAKSKPHIFDRQEVERNVILASIDCADLAQLCKKFGIKHTK